MMFNTAESVLIVEAGDTGKFSKLLYNMIGKNDDTDAGPTGPVDGSVDASIFNEGQFAQTAISSSQKVIFIGWPESAGDYIDAIRLDNPDAIDEEGIYIGVSGNHACIAVNAEPPSKEGYWDFLERAKEHDMDFDDLLATLRPREKTAEPDESDDSNPVLGFAKMACNAIGKAATDGANGINQAVVLHQKASEIREQRYQYAVKRFYYEKLKSFVEA